MRSPPSLENHFYAQHLERLLKSLRQVSGIDLTGGSSDWPDIAKNWYYADTPLLSHGTEADPILNYGNLKTLELFELDWPALVQMPSRLTAEAPERAERERLFQQVAEKGYIDNYRGIRISSSGKRFLIEAAVVWTVRDPNGQILGQAAHLPRWKFLDT